MFTIIDALKVVTECGSDDAAETLERHFTADKLLYRWLVSNGHQDIADTWAEATGWTLESEIGG